jgi:hypothetical protein
MTQALQLLMPVHRLHLCKLRNSAAPPQGVGSGPSGRISRIDLAGGEVVKQMEEAPLAFAVGRLQWALAQPLRWGEPEWPARTARALAGLQSALAWHTASLESRSGLFAEVVDPDLLPFTPAAEEVKHLRQEHRDYQLRLGAMQHQLARAMSAGANEWFRRLIDVARGAEQLATQMGEHLQSEKELSLAPAKPRAVHLGSERM